MRDLRPLIWKEWRDARTLVVGAVVLSVIASLGIHAWIFDFGEGALVARYGVALLIGLFVAAVSSDLVAGDVASGRVATWALLPTSTRSLWQAKAVFLTLATIGFALFTVVSQWLILKTLAAPFIVRDFEKTLPEALPYVAAAICCGGTVLFFSTLVERGFAAVLSGLTVIGASYALVRSINLSFYGVQPGDVGFAAALLVGGAVFFAAARTAFLRGPIHAGSKARLGGLAFGVAGALILPIGGGAAYAVHARYAVTPGSDRTHVRRMSASPDGRYLAVQWRNTGVRMIPNHGRQVGDYSARVWVFDLQTGTLVEVPERSTELFCDPTPWTPDGKLIVWTRESTAVLQDGTIAPQSPVEKRIIDPRSGETEKRERVHRIPTSALASGPGPWGSRVGWGTVSQRGATSSSGMQRWIVEWKDGRAMQVFDCVRMPTRTRIPGVVLHWGAGRELVRHDLETHTATTLLTRDSSDTGRPPPVYGSPDGSRLITWTHEGAVVLDGATGMRLAGPWKRGFASWEHGLGGSRFVTVSPGGGEDRPTLLVDLDKGRELELGLRVRSGHGTLGSPRLASLPDGRLITAVGAGPIVLRDADGNVLRTLYEGPGE